MNVIDEKKCICIHTKEKYLAKMCRKYNAANECSDYVA